MAKLQFAGWFAGLVVAAVAAPALAQSPAPQSGKFEECQQLKKLDVAIAACSDLIGAGSKDARVFINRGFAHFLRNEIDEAAPDLEEAVRLDPESAEAAARLGLVFHARGDEDGAIANATRALELGSRDISVYTDRGMARLAKGENRQAIADFTKVIDQDAGRTFVGQVALVVRGLAKLYSEDPGGAQVDLRLAYELNPKDPFFLMFLHIAEVGTGSPSSLAAAASRFDAAKWPGQAIRMFLHEATPEEVLAVKGGPVTICEADYLAGEFMRLEGKKDEAIRILRKADMDCPHHVLEGVAGRAALRSLSRH